MPGTDVISSRVQRQQQLTVLEAKKKRSGGGGGADENGESPKEMLNRCVWGHAQALDVCICDM